MKSFLSIAIVIIILIAVIVGIGGCSTYNGLITKSEDCSAKWSEIDNMLKRRADLIPNLVETVKGFAAHESEIFTNIANARSQLLNAKGAKEISQATGNFESALSRLLMISERYPELKSNQNFIRLQDELAGTENRLTVARTRYNEAVKNYNTAIKKFPGVLLAGFINMSEKEYFEISNPQDREVPKVKF